MRTRGLSFLRGLLHEGAVIWQAGVPGICVPEDDPELVQMVREDLQTIMAVLRRAEVFRRQLGTASVEPFLRFRHWKWTAEACTSCGGRVTEHEFLRCDLCALGVDLALAGLEPAPRVEGDLVR